MDKNLKTGIDASISILADNVVNGASLGENGFCAYISIDGQSYLFDTGITGICAIKNAYAMEINLRNISGIILSHGHLDHTAGLLDILQVSGTKTV
jgi:7,8-dihydropterin-6-yl-methyl-4-(beta-D-ribofuranosyl)aminobenzene 5'-phosphate synthase